METYVEFLNRINSFEKAKPDFGKQFFKCNPSLSNKVDKANKFKAFYGDTVVFELDEITKQKLSKHVDLLYAAVPQCFCERLVTDTFHVTLHDLSNSAVLRDIGEELFFNELKIIDLKKDRKIFGDTKIAMKSNNIFNMVNTSLVMGLYPADENEYCKLMRLYSAIDGIKQLNYPLTPHITLSYYNIDGFDRQSAKTLEDVVQRLNETEINIELNVANLFYQKFTSMNDYVNVICLGH